MGIILKGTDNKFNDDVVTNNALKAEFEIKPHGSTGIKGPDVVTNDRGSGPRRDILMEFNHVDAPGGTDKYMIAMEEGKKQAKFIRIRGAKFEYKEGHPKFWAQNNGLHPGSGNFQNAIKGLGHKEKDCMESTQGVLMVTFVHQNGQNHEEIVGVITN